MPSSKSEGRPHTVFYALLLSVPRILNTHSLQVVQIDAPLSKYPALLDCLTWQLKAPQRLPKLLPVNAPIQLAHRPQQPGGECPTQSRRLDGMHLQFPESDGEIPKHPTKKQKSGVNHPLMTSNSQSHFKSHRQTIQCSIVLWERAVRLVGEIPYSAIPGNAAPSGRIVEKRIPANFGIQKIYVQICRGV